jgi:hypothetical protein
MSLRRTSTPYPLELLAGDVVMDRPLQEGTEVSDLVVGQCHDRARNDSVREGRLQSIGK